MPFDEKKFRALLPADMLTEKRFVRYFLKAKPEGGTAKIPLGNHSDPETWSTFDDCVSKIENDQQGIGYCFLGGDIHGLDIDHCRNVQTGALCSEAMVLLSRLGSWSEYSVSGQGIHVFFKGHVRGKQLGETCLQYWNPKNSPRFFALTCDMVGDAFINLKDVGDEFNYIFATAKHISAKIREELKSIDKEQWEHLPKEREQEPEQREKTKQKTRKLHPDFNLEDFLKFYGLDVDNVANNSVGKCYRLVSCPIKGEKHVGQNSTTTNFILSSDGGLGFHCQSTGCVAWSVAEVIKKLAEDHEPYPRPIYVANAPTVLHDKTEYTRAVVLDDSDTIAPEHTIWLWPGYLPLNTLVHFAGKSAKGKSPVTLDIISRLSVGREWPDGTQNEVGSRRSVLLAGEDNWSTVIIPRLITYGADRKLVSRMRSVLRKNETDIQNVQTALAQDVASLEKVLDQKGDVSLIVVDPVTNYLGGLSMNKESEMRDLLMPLAELAQRKGICIVTVGHLNKKTNAEGVQLLDRVMGAAAFHGVARQTFLFGDDPEDDDKFTHIMNFGRPDDKPNLRYKTVKQQIEFEGKKSDVISVEWLGAAVENNDVEESMDGPKQRDKSTAKTVKELIRNTLKDGQKTTEHIAETLKQAGIDEKFQWQRIARKLAKSGKGGVDGKGPKFYWWLPIGDQLEFDR